MCTLIPLRHNLQTSKGLGALLAKAAKTRGHWRLGGQKDEAGPARRASPTWLDRRAAVDWIATHPVGAFQGSLSWPRSGMQSHDVIAMHRAPPNPACLGGCQ